MIDAALVAKSALAGLGMMALQGTILAVLAMLLLRGHMRPAWQAAVWLVVLVKFILPWGPAMPWSLADLIAILRGDAAETAAVALPAATGSALAGAPPVSLAWLALAAGWLAGALIVVARAFAGHRRTLHAMSACRAAPCWARELLSDLVVGHAGGVERGLDRLGARRVRLLVGDAATGPYVVGIVRPTIVVPPALLDDRALLRAALLHELAHVRRLDALGRIVQLIAHAMFWWCPVVQLVDRRLDRARESACDARALEVGQISRPAYARLLLQMAQLNACTHGSSLAAPYALDNRIASVLGPPMRSRLGLVHGVGLVVWVALSLGGARTASARGIETCVYTFEFAEALRQAHPEADLDQDGVLSHDEACDFQAEVRRTSVANTTTPVPERQVSTLLAEPLCCNCTTGEGLSEPAATSCNAE